MARILEIRKRSNEYIASLDDNVTRVIEGQGQLTVNINRSQMIANKDANGRPLIHKRTGSDRLSAPYARRTGKSRPDLFVRGDFQFAMFLVMPTAKEYIISSDNELVKYLPVNYGKIFGISPENQPKAQKINDTLIISDYMKTVFNI